jgi:AraC-like DNA-binding protein
MVSIYLERLAPIMHTRTSELTEETAGRGEFALFDRVDRFRFVARRGAMMRTVSHLIGAATVGRVESTGHDIALDERERGTILLPRRGRLVVEDGRRELQAGPGGAILLRPGFRTTRVRAGSEGDFLALVLLVPGKLCRPDDEEGSGRVLPPVAENVSATALLQALGMAIEVLGRPDAGGLPPRIVAGWDSMLTNLFGTLAGEAVPEGRAAPALVRRAEAFMRAHSDRPLTMPEVAAACGVGVRRLQGAFRALRGVPPQHALADVRLERARERLLAAARGTTVTEVAVSCGIMHAGRFAVAYRARFGESPSATMRGRRD